MTKIYCTVAIKLYYRRLRDFSAWNLSHWRSLSWFEHNKLPCGGKTAANMEMMYDILTEAWFYKYTQSVLLLCFMYVWFTEQWKAGGELWAFLHSKTSTCTTADRFRSLTRCVYPAVSITMNIRVWLFLPSLFRFSVKRPPHDFATTTKWPATLPEPVCSLMFGGLWSGSPCEGALA